MNMPRYCCVPNCDSHRPDGTYTTSFRFPQNEERRRVWKKAISRDFEPNKNTVVCIKHFSEECILRVDIIARKDGTVSQYPRVYPKLTDTACPKIFPNCPSYFTKVDQPRKATFKRKKKIQQSDEHLFLELMEKKIESMSDIESEMSKTTGDEDDEDKPSPEKENLKDDDEELMMTDEELKDYSAKLIEKYLEDPKINILISMKQQLHELESKIVEKDEELGRMQKFFDLLMRDQEKFFRHEGVLPKLEKRDVSVNVDFPPEVSITLYGAADIGSTGIDKAGISAKTSLETSINPTPHHSTQSSSGINEKPEVKMTAVNTQVPKDKVPTKSSVEVIDLTDEEELGAKGGASQAMSTKSNLKSPVSTYSSPSKSLPTSENSLKHPAPLPTKQQQGPLSKTLQSTPPKPTLKISAENHGIVLQWNLSLLPYHATIVSYEIYGYQESKTGPINSSLWKKIGDVKALTLPMACTLTQFMEGFKYHFAIRAVDIYSRPGYYSDPASIIFVPEGQNSKRVVKTEYIYSAK